MEDYHDMTVAQHQARELMLSKGENSLRTSLLADGVELVEMPLRYDRHVSLCICVCVCQYVSLLVPLIVC